MTDVLTTQKSGWTTASAILFDLDGVLTPTATVHEQAWKELFEGYLASRPDVPGYREEDYFDHIDGKPRFDGVRDFLASRGIVPRKVKNLPPVQAATVRNRPEGTQQALIPHRPPFRDSATARTRYSTTSSVPASSPSRGRCVFWKPQWPAD
jgi:FMN phosphatase YigB (HAD superfamily)